MESVIPKEKGTVVDDQCICYSPSQGRIQDFWKGGSFVEGVGVRFANFISFFLNVQ